MLTAGPVGTRRRVGQYRHGESRTNFDVRQKNLGASYRAANQRAVRKLFEFLLFACTPYDSGCLSNPARDAPRYAQPVSTPVAATRTVWSGLLRSLAARGLTLPIAAVLSLATSSFLIRFYGADSYAQFALMVSVISVLPFADLGIGAAVINAASTANTGGSRHHAEAVVAGALRALTVVGAVITVLATTITLLGGWQSILGRTLQDDSTTAVGICIALFAVALPVNVCQRVAVGVGANDKQIVLLVIQPLLTLTFVVITAVTFHQPSLAFVSFFFAYLLTSFANLYFANRWSDGLISAAARRAVRVRDRLNVTREIVDAALPMSVMMIGIPLVLQGHRIMLSTFGSVDEVARYSLASQIFIPITALAAAASTTLWPFFARARMESARTGPTRSSNPFLFSAILAGSALLLCAVLTTLSPWVSGVISGGAVHVSITLGIASTAFVVAQIAQAPLGVFLTDVVGLRFQALCTAPLVVVVWAASRFSIERAGSEGVLWMTAAALVLLQIVPFALFITRRGNGRRGRYRRELGGVSTRLGRLRIPLDGGPRDW